MKLERIVETGANVSSCVDSKHIPSAPLPPRVQKTKKPLSLPSAQYTQQEKVANKVYAKHFRSQKWSDQAIKACADLAIDLDSLH